MNTPRTVLITGVAGFIGSTLADRLLADGRRVVGLDNFDPYYPQELKRANLARASESPDFSLIEGDIRDPGALQAAFEAAAPDAVVHLAALAGVRPSLDRPADYADVNVTGFSRLLEVAVGGGSPRIVFASSSSVYGERESGPFRESDPVERPVSPYAATKRAGELVAHSFHHDHGISVTCVRIFTCYGPRQRPDLAIRKFAERMLRGESIPVYGDGSSLRDFTYVDDLVEGLVRAVDTDLGFELLNFGAGRQVSVSQVVSALEAELGVKARIEFLPPQVGDVPRTWADVSRAEDRLGYRPAVAFEEGIARFCAWLRGGQ